MKITPIGIDLAKAVFQVHGVDEHGKAVLRKQLRRKEVLSLFANLQPCLIGRSRGRIPQPRERRSSRRTAR